MEKKVVKSINLYYKDIGRNYMPSTITSDDETIEDIIKILEETKSGVIKLKWRTESQFSASYNEDEFSVPREEILAYCVRTNVTFNDGRENRNGNMSNVISPSSIPF